MRPRVGAAVIVLAILVPGGCWAGAAAGVSSAAFDSPTTSALSWFAAVNRKDRAAALTHFEPGSAPMGDWGSGPNTWPAFYSVECRDESETPSSVNDVRVHCVFHESDAPAVGQPSSWWDVYLRRQADGRWLIYSYGQG